VQHSFSTIRTHHVVDDISQSLTAQQRDMEAAATSLQGQLQTVQRSMEDLYTSQMANQDHENILLRQFAGEMAAIRNSQALLADLVEKTKEEAQAQRAADKDGSGGAVHNGVNNQGVVMRDNGGTINLGSKS
jgi:DNA-binding transcriptional regulator YbjK